MSELSSTDARIAAAKARLAANLGELQQRVSHAREMVSPATVVKPWLKAGAVAAMGYLLVRSRQPKQLASGAHAPATARPRLRSLVSYAVTALAGAVISRMLDHERARKRSIAP